MGEIHVILDNSLGFIRQTDYEDRVRHHPAFSRMHHVYQNSAAYLTWPTMRNQRFEHSLGTKHLAGKFFFNAVQNTDPATLKQFYKEFQTAILNLVSESPADFVNVCNDLGTSFQNSAKTAIKQKDPAQHPGYCDFLVPSNVPNEYRMTHCLLIQAVRMAGMLHDVGHPPFSHVCEAALVDAYRVIAKRIASGKTLSKMAKELFDAVNKILDGHDISEVDLHEEIGKELTDMLLVDVCKNVALADLRSVYIVEALIVRAIFSNEGLFESLHEIVCGMVDVDRMDYVKRDSINSGIGSDIQYDRILDGVRIVRRDAKKNNKKVKGFVFPFPLKSLDTVELFLRKRYENYRTVIYHHNVMKSDALMRAAVTTLVQRVLNSKKKPSRNLSMPHDISGLWHPIVVSKMGIADALLAYSQWNDAWLISTLTEEYTQLRVKPEKTEEDQLLEHQLGELLFSERHYRSLVKRKVDCDWFRDELARLLEGDDELNNALEKYRSDSPDAAKKKRSKKDAPKSDRLIEDLKNLARGLESSNLNSLREFAEVFDVITEKSRAAALTSDAAVSYPDELAEVIKRYIREFINVYEVNGEKVKCRDVLVGWNRINAGTNGLVFFYDSNKQEPNENDLLKFGDVSRLPLLLRGEVSDMPAFFAYLYLDGGSVGDEFWKALELDLARRLHEFMREAILETCKLIVDSEQTNYD